MKTEKQIEDMKELIGIKISRLTTEIDCIKNPTTNQKYDFNIEATKLMTQYDILLDVLNGWSLFSRRIKRIIKN